MRIIAGEMRSRTIVAPKGLDTRPTLDRTRESLFSIIQADVPGAAVLDLYTGSGALALEALSRGAEKAVLVDCSREASKAVNTNLDTLKVRDRAEFLYMKDEAAVTLLGSRREKFDLVFLDPPYRMDTVPACEWLHKAGVLKEAALIVIEHLDDADPVPPSCYRRTDRRKYRDTAISFYRYEVSEDGKDLDLSGQL